MGECKVMKVVNGLERHTLENWKLKEGTFGNFVLAHIKEVLWFLHWQPVARVSATTTITAPWRRRRRQQHQQQQDQHEDGNNDINHEYHQKKYNLKIRCSRTIKIGKQSHGLFHFTSGGRWGNVPIALSAFRDKGSRRWSLMVRGVGRKVEKGLLWSRLGSSLVVAWRSSLRVVSWLLSAYCIRGRRRRRRGEGPRSG